MTTVFDLHVKPMSHKKILPEVGANALYDFIKLNQSVDINTFTTNFNTVSKRTVERWLKKLKDEDKMEFKEPLKQEDI